MQYKQVEKQIVELQARLGNVGQRQAAAALRVMDGDSAALDEYLLCSVEREAIPAKLKDMYKQLVELAKSELRDLFVTAWREVERILTERQPMINRLTQIENQRQDILTTNQVPPPYLKDQAQELRALLADGEPGLAAARAELAKLGQEAEKILGHDVVAAWGAELTIQREQRAGRRPAGPATDGKATFERAQVW